MALCEASTFLQFRIPCLSSRLLACFIYFTTLLFSGEAFIRDECKSPLGMESGAIADDALSSSQNFVPSSGPSNARLNIVRGSGAWCTAVPVKSSSQEYISINLGSSYYITAIATQGRSAGKGNEWTDAYVLDFERNESEGWLRWRNGSNDVEAILGNSDSHSVVYRTLDPPIFARKITLTPIAIDHRRIVRHFCLRLELYGCPMSNGLLSYSVRDERQMLDGHRFEDHGGYGLGKLTDGYVGGQAWPLRNDSLWMGWRMNSTTDQHLDISFRFAERSYFEEVRIHTANYPAHNVSEFVKLNVWFSEDGLQSYSKDMVTITVEPGLHQSRWIVASLQDRRADSLQLRFTVTSEWLLLSEVDFKTKPLSGDSSRSSASQFPPPSRNDGQMGSSLSFSQDDFFFTNKELLSNVSAPSVVSTNHLAMSGQTPSLDHRGTFILIGSLLGVAMVILLIVVTAIVYLKKNRHSHKQCPLPAYYTKAFVPGSPFTRSHDDESPVQDTAFVPGSPLSDDVSKKLPFSRYTPIHENDAVEKHILLTQRDKESPDFSFPPSKHRHPLFLHISGSNEYQALSSVKPLLSPDDQDSPVYASADVGSYRTPSSGTEDQSPGSSSNPSSSCGSVKWDLLSNDEISRLCDLHFVQKLGEGKFGDVNLFIQKEKFVVAKMLRESAPAVARDVFRSEMLLMSGIKHPHMSQVLGQHLQGNCMLLEYGDQGDLYHYLRTNKSCIMYKDMVSIACQTCDAMEYLEKHDMVHRDLACRNISLDANLYVRVGDIARWRPEFSEHYVNLKEDTTVPIRWMAWESLVQGVHTNKSDVWSFGLTLWEIFTFCSFLPLQSLSNQQIIDRSVVLSNHATFAVPLPPKDNRCMLSRPSLCPEQLWNVVLDCWQISPSHRPKFSELHEFLCYLHACAVQSVHDS